MLAGVDAAGNPVTQPFDHEATLAVDEEGLPRSRRGGKSKKTAAGGMTDEHPRDRRTGQPVLAMDETGQPVLESIDRMISTSSATFDGTNGRRAPADRCRSGALLRFFRRLSVATARGDSLQPVGPGQAAAADAGAAGRRGLRRQLGKRRCPPPAPWKWCTPIRWSTTTCRRWTTTICAAAGRRVTRRSAKRWRFWPATRCWRWPSKCWPTTFSRRQWRRAAVPRWPKRPAPRRWSAARPTIWPCEFSAGDLAALEVDSSPQDRRHVSGLAAAGRHVAGADERQLAALERYGRSIGLAFQITDDLLDVRGDEAAMGKRVGKDSQHGKLTFPACWASRKASAGRNS